VIKEKAMSEKRELTSKEIEKIKQNEKTYIYYTPSEAMHQLIAKMPKNADAKK
jgi:hypothetical protein